MIALIDGDIIVYRVGFTTNEEPLGIALARTDTLIENILRALDTTEYKVYLTSQDKSNFRFEVYPEYKANRKAPKPTWYLELREYLVQEHEAVVVTGREADDALADRQSPETCICSIDKDLDQVAGKHYDFVKNAAYDVSREGGIWFFWKQLLQGDSTDNIPGVQKVGPKTARAILDTCHSEREYLEAVRAKYREVYGKDGDRLMLMYGRCLKIGGDIWDGGLIGNKESTGPDSKPELDPSSNETDSSSSLES